MAPGNNAAGALLYQTYNTSGNVTCTIAARALQAALRHAIGVAGDELPGAVAARLDERIANIQRKLHTVEFRSLGKQPATNLSLPNQPSSRCPG